MAEFVLDRAERLSVADAKARFSSVVARMAHGGAPCVITRYGTPIAVISPMPTEEPRAPRARGILSHIADPAKRAAEEGAFARAMVVKHDHAS